jgi:eukaryotic-like serine/threonine-protein kinase
MIAANVRLDEDRFADLVAAMDEALAVGLPLAVAPSMDVPHEMAVRLEGAQTVLTRLRRRLPCQGSPALAQAARQVGRYQIRRVLGQGGFGLVFLAYDPLLNRHVAVKVPRLEGLMTLDLRERFVQEAKAMAKLDHGHLVPVYDYGEVGAVCYLVTAYCHGGSLASWLGRQRHPVPTVAAVRLLRDLGMAVQYIHAQGILHCDLKPANILFSDPDADSNAVPELEGGAAGQWAPATSGIWPLVARISDFGLAKALQCSARSLQNSAIFGTPGYMAPEQAEGRLDLISTTTDVYALGVILYELLTGSCPFLGGNAEQIMRKVASEEPMRPRAKRPDIPARQFA